MAKTEKQTDRLATESNTVEESASWIMYALANTSSFCALALKQTFNTDKHTHTHGSTMHKTFCPAEWAQPATTPAALLVKYKLDYKHAEAAVLQIHHRHLWGHLL